MNDLKRNLNVVFYIGTSRLVACLAEMEPDRVRILRFTQIQNPPGFQKGGVAQLDKALTTVEGLLEGLELGEDLFRIPAAVMVSTPSLKMTRFSSSVYYSGYPRVVTSREVHQVVEQTRNVAPLSLQDWILKTVPESFWVNDMTDVENPVGLEAQRLAVTLQIFSVDYSFYRNLSRVFETLELPVKGYFPKTYFLPGGAFTNEEKEGETFLIDLSDEVTHLLLVREGKIVQTKSLDLGGRFLSAKMAERWKIGTADAKRLKERFGSLEDLKLGGELIPLFDESGRENHQIRRAEFHEAFQGFAEEFFSRIRKEILILLNQAAIREPRFVLTGGGAKLEGMVDFLGGRLNHPVRLATPRQIEAPSELRLDAAWAAPVGFLLWAHEQAPEAVAKEHAFTRVLTQAKEFITAYF